MSSRSSSAFGMKVQRLCIAVSHYVTHPQGLIRWLVSILSLWTRETSKKWIHYIRREDFISLLTQESAVVTSRVMILIEPSTPTRTPATEERCSAHLFEWNNYSTSAPRRTPDMAEERSFPSTERRSCACGPPASGAWLLLISHSCGCRSFFRSDWWSQKGSGTTEKTGGRTVCPSEILLGQTCCIRRWHTVLH